MAKRKVYTVGSNGQRGQWRATRAGDVLVSSALKAEAIRIAKERESASVQIKDRDGKIQEEQTSPRGSGLDARNEDDGARVLGSARGGRIAEIGVRFDTEG